MGVYATLQLEMCHLNGRAPGPLTFTSPADQSRRFRHRLPVRLVTPRLLGDPADPSRPPASLGGTLKAPAACAVAEVLVATASCRYLPVVVPVFIVHQFFPVMSSLCCCPAPQAECLRCRHRARIGAVPCHIVTSTWEAVVTAWLWTLPWSVPVR